MTREQEIADRLAKATTGEWEAILPSDPRGLPSPMYRGLVCILSHDPDGRLCVVTDGRTCAKSEWEANATLIANAPADLAYYRDTVAGLRARIERLEKWLFRIKAASSEEQIATLVYEALEDKPS